MSNISDLKPWFREDLERIFMAVYFSAQDGQDDPQVRKGMALVVASLCLMFGIDALRILRPGDVQLLRKDKDGAIWKA